MWFPFLNWRRVENFPHEYRALHVLSWTFVLGLLGAAATAAYTGSQLVLVFLQRLVDGFRESVVVERLATRFRNVPVLGPLLNATHKDRSDGSTRTLLDAALDSHIADIFNYVDDAGAAAPFVPGAARAIYDVFRRTLSDAVVRDGCTEIQILAHSLGSVITYHALTTYRDETEQLVSLGDVVDGRPPLTRVFTIGSPLEKFRFFWPKLIAGREASPTEARFEWHNFNSPGDIVAGPLRTYDWVPKISNHPVNGAWGLFTAHTGYRKHPSFLSVFGPAVTGQAPAVRLTWTQPVGRTLRGLGEFVFVPLGLLVLVAVGGAYMYVVGAAGGWLIGMAVSLPVDGIRLSLGYDWVFHFIVREWSPTILGWTSVTLSIPMALIWGYQQGSELHKSHWSAGFALERRRHVSENPSVYRDPRSYGVLAAQVVILAVIAWVSLRVRPGSALSRSEAWLLILGLMAAFAVLAGRGITGYWRGILIDNRNKISLARFQLLIWTLVVLSAIVTAGITNAAFGAQSPLSIQIPQELWVLLGISTASAVAGPAVLATKRDKTPDPNELLNTVSEIKKTDSMVRIDTKHSGVLVRNESPEDARWGDLLKGDESGNAATVDLGKLQMFFFTFVLALGYAVAIGRLFDGAGGIAALPVVDSSMNTLLGISHTGHLANKAVSHSRELQPPSPPATTDGKALAVGTSSQEARS